VLEVTLLCIITCKLYKKSIEFLIFPLVYSYFSVLYIVLSFLNLILRAIDRVSLGQIDSLFNKGSGIPIHVIFGKCN
jgi:hypothetical protein